MTRAACMATCLLSLACFARSQSWLPASGFDSPQNIERLAKRAERLASAASSNKLCEETLQYRMRAFGMPGVVNQVLEYSTFAGREMYFIRQDGAVAGQRQAEKVFVEISTMLPHSYCRERAKNSKESRLDRKDWDWLGLRLFSEGLLMLDGNPSRTLYRRAERIDCEYGKVPIDPLSAVMLYRHKALMATNALPEIEWNILEGNDGLYLAVFRPATAAQPLEHPALGSCKIAQVEIRIFSATKDKTREAGHVRIDLALDKQAMPVKYEGVWRGIPFEMILTNATAQAKQ